MRAAVVVAEATCRLAFHAFFGPPGVGKKMLAVGLVRASVDAGYRTYYTTAADLPAKCHRAALEGRWATTTRFDAAP